MESFHALLKKEKARINKYIDFEDARISMFEYIEGWYNRKRILCFILGSILNLNFTESK